MQTPPGPLQSPQAVPLQRVGTLLALTPGVHEELSGELQTQWALASASS